MTSVGTVGSAEQPGTRCAGASPRALGIQVVVYDSDVAQQVRLAAAVGAAARRLRANGDVGHVVLRFGDCSATPNFMPADEATIRAAAGAAVDEVMFTFFGANLGSGGGSNALAALGDDELIWILNPDTYPSPESGVHLLATVDLEGVGIAEARQIPIEHQKAHDPATGETSWACGFGMLIHRHVFDAVDGFDAHFFPLYCDDVDLSWRVRLAGWSVRHVPRAVVFHDKLIGGGGSVRWSDHEARSSHLARLWLYRRYGRPDLATAFIDGIDPADTIALDAIAEFHERCAIGDAPEPIDRAESVAQFVDGQYAPKRFSYAR